MRIVKLALVCAAIVPGATLAGSQGHDGTGIQERVALDGAYTLVANQSPTRPGAEGSQVGCTINVRASNKGRYKTAISRDSQVKLRNGTWKKLNKSVWIGPGQTVPWTYNLDFGCNNDRTYRFLVKRFDSSNNLLGEQWHYHPARFRNRNGQWSYSYSRDVSLDIGDLNRFF